MKTKTFVLVGIFLGINAMLGAWWYSTNAEQQARNDEVAQAYEVGDYKALNAIGLEEFISLPAPSQEQVIVSLIKINDLERAQEYLSKTINRSDNIRLYNKLITFVLQKDWDAVERISTTERTNNKNVRSLVLYFRALALFNKREYENAQLLLEESLKLDGLAPATLYLEIKLLRAEDFQQHELVIEKYSIANKLGGKMYSDELLDLGIAYYNVGESENMYKSFGKIQNDENYLYIQILKARDALRNERYNDSEIILLDLLNTESDWTIYLWLGRTHLQEGERGLAKKRYEEGLEISNSWEILTDLLIVYNALGETEKIKLISYQIEQLLGSNVTIHIGVLRRFIEIYDMPYLRKYADIALKNYQNGRFELEDADERYESSVETLYETIQDSYITLMVNEWYDTNSGNEYRDTLIGMEDLTDIAYSYLLLSFEKIDDINAMSRITQQMGDTIDQRELSLIRIFNRIYLKDYTGAINQLLDSKKDLNEIDVLWLIWKISNDQSRLIDGANNNLRNFLDATNKEFVDLDEGFDEHFGSLIGKIGNYYEPKE